MSNVNSSRELLQSKESTLGIIVALPERHNLGRGLPADSRRKDLGEVNSSRLGSHGCYFVGEPRALARARVTPAYDIFSAEIHATRGVSYHGR